MNGSPKVATCSALQQQGIAEAWKIVEEFENHQKNKGYFAKTRKEQALNWFREYLSAKLLESVYENPQLKEKLRELEKRVSAHRSEPHAAANEFLELLWGSRLS